MRRAGWLLIVSVLVGLSVHRAAAADDGDKSYEIKMDRPAKVGDRYHLEALVATRTTSSVKVEGAADARPVDEAVGIRFEGDVEVAAVRDFKQKELEVKPEDVGGGSKLLEVAKVEGVPCYKLEVSFEGKNLKGTCKGAAEGMTLEKGSIKGTVTVLLPTDNKTGHLKESGTVTIESHLVGKNDDGKRVTADTKVEEMVEKTMVRGK